MALAPYLSRKRGLFGASTPNMISETRPTIAAGGMGGGGNPPAVVAAAPDEPRKGFDWGKALGVLGDSLSILGGGQASYVPLMQQRRLQAAARAYAEQQYQRRRADEQQDWEAREQWKRDHPAPVNNDTVADYNFWKQTLAPDQFKTWLQNRIDPPQYRQGPDGSFYRINPTAPPSFSAEDWESGTPMNGGPTPSASGGFR